MCFSPQRRAIFRHQNFKKFSEDYSFSTFSLPNVLVATAACNFSTSELQKVLRLWTFSLPNVLFATAACIFSTSELPKVHRRLQFFNIFTSKCAFRHSGMQFFDIRTYKSGPDTSCFVYFHFRTCLSPQVRAFFQHQNLQKWSGHVMFCVFSLPNVPFASGACIFSTSELPKVVQAPHVLYIFTSKCAFRHSGVQFLISPLSSDLRTRRFNRPTFGLTRHTNPWKNTAFRDVSNIWHGCIFFLLTFALLHLFTSDLTALLCCL